jgi:hypothetical protein
VNEELEVMGQIVKSFEGLSDAGQAWVLSSFARTPTPRTMCKVKNIEVQLDSVLNSVSRNPSKINNTAEVLKIVKAAKSQALGIPDIYAQLSQAGGTLNIHKTGVTLCRLLKQKKIRRVGKGLYARK